MLIGARLRRMVEVKCIHASCSQQESAVMLTMQRRMRGQSKGSNMPRLAVRGSLVAMHNAFKNQSQTDRLRLRLLGTAAAWYNDSIQASVVRSS